MQDTNEGGDASRTNAGNLRVLLRCRGSNKRNKDASALAGVRLISALQARVCMHQKTVKYAAS